MNAFRIWTLVDSLLLNAACSYIWNNMPFYSLSYYQIQMLCVENKDKNWKNLYAQFNNTFLKKQTVKKKILLIR
jgi:hypothetical protein